MKIAIVSDLHLYHWYNRTRLLHERLPSDLVAESVAKEKPDLIIDAGDTEMPELLDEALVKAGAGGTPIFTVPGNHDYYGKWWNGAAAGCASGEFGGTRVAGATLWTDLNNNNPVTSVVVREYLMDFHVIKGFSTMTCWDAHLFQRRYIELSYLDSRVDVIVTHHAPSFKSVHPRFAHLKEANHGFASHMDDVVMASGAKLWVHGHMHNDFDYMIGDTRVICHPCGYPGEHRREYQPMYVEL